VNLSSSPANEYFSDGLTEELTADIARIQDLRVVARTTAFQFQGKPQDVRTIGQQLNVRAVLEGSVRWQGSRVKITAQLNGTENGYHLWSHIYEGDAGDVFHIQEQVAQEIADALNRQLRQSHLPRPGTENLEARNLYLEGLHLQNTTEPRRLHQAILNFRRASQLDNQYAAPQAGLAVCYVMLAWGGVMRPEEAYRLAGTAAQEAVKLDDNLSTAHTSKGIVALMFDWDWTKAAQEFQRALDLNPSDAEAHHWYSHYLVVTNQIDASLEESRRAMKLDPLNFLISAHLGWHLSAGTGIRSGNRGVEEDPRAVSAYKPRY
jgi:serine/threonine-protein kinase